MKNFFPLFTIYFSLLVIVTIILPAQIFAVEKTLDQKKTPHKILAQKTVSRERISREFLSQNSVSHERISRKLLSQNPVITRLELTGNHLFSDIRLKMRTKTWTKTLIPWKKGPFNLQWLKKDIQNLLAFYRDKGFADIAISQEIVKEQNNSYFLRLIIQEGLKYHVSFKGADFFYDWQLKQELDIFKNGNLEDRGLKKTARRIQKRYVTAGFQDVKIDFQKKRIHGEPGQKKLKENKRDLWDVEYIIKEGKRIIVDSVTIKGNTKISEKEIHKEMLLSGKGLLTKKGFSTQVLTKDIHSIKALYLSHGFRKATVKETHTISPSKPADKKHPEALVHINIHIEEGMQSQVMSAQITGLCTLLDEKEIIQKLALKPGQPFREYMIRSDENIIAGVVAEKGYPHVKVKGKATYEKKPETVKLRWHVTKGPFTRVGKIKYTGNDRLRQSIMEQLIQLKSGDPFSLKEILQAEKRLRTIRAIKSVDIKAPGLENKNKVADLEVTVEERNPYYVEAALGFDTERLAYLNAETGDTNWLGRDIDAWIKGGVSSIGIEGEAGVKDPFFLKTDMAAALSIFAGKKEELNQDFGVNSWGVSSSLTKPFLTNFNAGVSLTYENRVRFGDEEEYLTVEDPGEAFETRNILKTSFVLAHDTRDSAIRPKRGMLSSLKADIYSGFDNDLDRFVRYIMDVRGYHTLFAGVTLALRTSLGYIQPFSSDNLVAEDHLFFLGGTSDVRGFKENMLSFDPDIDPAGGKSMISTSLESRIGITKNIEGLLFWDGGRIGQFEQDVLEKGFRSSLGCGLSYITAIGPVTLLYGYKLNQKANESPGRFHFSLGYTF